MTDQSKPQPKTIVFTDNHNAGTTDVYLRELFAAIAKGFDNLTSDSDETFAAQMDDRFTKYGSRLKISSKQFGWLQNIRRKAEQNDREDDRAWNRK